MGCFNIVESIVGCIATFSFNFYVLYLRPREPFVECLTLPLPWLHVLARCEHKPHVFFALPHTRCAAVVFRYCTWHLVQLFQEVLLKIGGVCHPYPPVGLHSIFWDKLLGTRMRYMGYVQCSSNRVKRITSSDGNVSCMDMV